MGEPKNIGLVDEPRNRLKGQDDLLKADRYAKALADFVRTSNTPITIGIQGEWGSGKTSLLYSIWSELESPSGNGDGSQGEENLVVWVNSWEHSLLASPEESLLSIIQEITTTIGQDKSNASMANVKKSIGKLGKSALRMALAASMGKAAVDVGDEYLTETNTIKELRKALQEVIAHIVKHETNSYKRVIVFVDDLDRIEPANAVRVLELMKNIFSMEHCVFILAIDYNVVVKGLKDKFGKMTEENEYEFRAFFDKIIQLPFTMPIEHYDSGSYFQKLLEEIGYLEEGEVVDLISEILDNSIGNNPRSIKRLVNSVALIQLVNSAQTDSDQISGEAEKNEETSAKKQVLIGLVALQISAPKIYEMLGRESDFTKWTQKGTAFRATQGKERYMEGFDEQYKLMTSEDAGEDFDTDWKKALFRVCYTTPRLRAQAPKLSKLLSNLENLCEGLDLGATIEWALGQTAVTSVSAEHAPSESSGTRLSGNEQAEKWKIYEKMAEMTKSKKRSKHSKVYANSGGYQYRKLTYFPGAYVDAHGYVIFKDKNEYGKHVKKKHGKNTVTIKGNLNSLEAYVQEVHEGAVGEEKSG